MIEVLPESQNNLLAIKARGKLTHQDYQQTLIPQLERVISKHGKARLLCDMGEDFPGWELKAMWDDAKFGLAHKNDFEKIAVVGGGRWVEWGAKVGALLMSGEMKTFPYQDAAEAWTWIKS